MSRVIIKNLPKGINEERLIDHFSKCGQVTDVSLKYARSGAFRQFAFVGFQTESEAQLAIDYCNKSYIDSFCIEVEIARPYGDIILPRPWSKHSKGSSANQKRKLVNDHEKVLTNVKKKCMAQSSGLSKMLGEYNNLEHDPEFSGFIAAHEAKYNSSTHNMDSLPFSHDNSEKHTDTDTVKADVDVDDDSSRITESGRLFIRNLSYSVTEDDLTGLFSSCGPVTEVLLPKDRKSGKSIGIAYVCYMLPSNALKALKKFDGSIFQGRLLHIMPSLPKPSSSVSTSNTSYKAKKMYNLKQSADCSHNWNSLFLGVNTVADVMTEKYMLDKSELFEAGDKDSIAVRLALGETQIVSETREFLESNGVVLDAFGRSNQERSDTVIIVKNIPFATSPDELLTLFSPYGVISKVVLPPHGISAIVEFQDAVCAKIAFSSLSYTKFKQLPLYLEWAPIGLLANNYSSMGSKNCKILVRNLPFEATKSEITQLFHTFGELKHVRLPEKGNKCGHRGFAFVEFMNKEDALRAFESLCHSTHLYGRRLVLDWADNGETVDEIRTKTKKYFSKKMKKGKETKKLIMSLENTSLPDSIEQ